MKIPTLAAALCSALTAQLHLPPDTYHPVGKADWVFATAPFAVHTSMTCALSDRTLDPGYGSTGRFAVNAGASFYVRGSQRDDLGDGYLAATWPGIFIFGPRTDTFVRLASVFEIDAEHNILFQSQGTLEFATHNGPHESNSGRDVWAVEVEVPNNPGLVGSEWEAQAAFFATGSGKVHVGTSHYVRVW